MNASLIHKASGQSIPAVQVTSGNVAYVKFSTDSSIVNQGFNLSWGIKQGKWIYNDKTTLACKTKNTIQKVCV